MTAWRPAALGYLLPYGLPVAMVQGASLGGIGAWIVPLLVFVAIPLVDALVGTDESRLAPPASTRSINGYDLLLYGWLPVQFASLAWSLAIVADLSSLDRFALALSLGILTGGIGITVAHELGHRRRPRERAIAALLLSSVGYLHFLVEHNRGHHARVATREDPATARRGESLYRFLPRTLVGSYLSAWRLEGARRQRRGLPLLAVDNLVLLSPLVSLAWLGIALAVAGAAGGALWLVQSAVAVLLLEAVNYVEHYGLERQTRADGRPVPVAPHHSWNASFRLSNWFLFNLQRHSHHHADAGRHYESLEHSVQGPQLPAGYPLMLLVATVPPLWRRAIEPRLAAHRQAHPALLA